MIIMMITKGRRKRTDCLRRQTKQGNADAREKETQSANTSAIRCTILQANRGRCDVRPDKPGALPGAQSWGLGLVI